MFYICIPSMNHNSINIISDEYNININKSNAIFTNDYYLYKVNNNLTSGVSYQINSNNTKEYLITSNMTFNNYNYILMNDYNYYDTGFAKIYHEDENHLIMMINNKIIEIFI